MLERVTIAAQDGGATRRFYVETVGLDVAHAEAGLVRFARDGGAGLTLIAAGHGAHTLGGERDRPTESLTLTFAGVAEATDPDGNAIRGWSAA